MENINFFQTLMEKAGFEEIKAKQAKKPLGPWPKDPRLKKVGAMVLLHSETVFKSYGIATFTQVLGMDPDKARKIYGASRAGVRNKNYHMYSLQ